MDRYWFGTEFQIQISSTLNQCTSVVNQAYQSSKAPIDPLTQCKLQHIKAKQHRQLSTAPGSDTCPSITRTGNSDYSVFINVLKTDHHHHDHVLLISSSSVTDAFKTLLSPAAILSLNPFTTNPIKALHFAILV